MTDYKPLLRVTAIATVLWAFFAFEPIPNPPEADSESDQTTTTTTTTPAPKRAVNCTLKPEAKTALSAIRRAKSAECKQQLLDLGCKIQESGGLLHAEKLPHLCPKTASSKYVGCYRDFAVDNRALKGYFGQPAGNTPTVCWQECFRQGFAYAGMQYGTECHCSNRIGNGTAETKVLISPRECSMPCAGDPGQKCGGTWALSVYETGLKHFNYFRVAPADAKQTQRARVLFLLMLNGRAIRQIMRLLRVIYRSQHYYYLHVDSGNEYLHGELKKLVQGISNIAVTENVSPVIWGGPSFLRAYINVFDQVLVNYPDWNWDYIINYSESDFQLLPVGYLANFLSSNNGGNFLRSHHATGGPTEYFKGQGFDSAFWECDDHAYIVGTRQYPWGVWYDGGADWFALHRDFVNYTTYSQDGLVLGLKNMFNYSFASPESFFHTLVRNSRFCGTFRDNNLKLINWDRSPGSRMCQASAAADFRGCSPKVLEIRDTQKFQAGGLKKMNLYSGRKFESIIDLDILNWLELNNLNVDKRIVEHPSWDMYWQNIYHPEYDPSPSHASKLFAKALVQFSAASLIADDEPAKGCFQSRLRPTEQWLLLRHGTQHVLQSFELPYCNGAIGQILIGKKLVQWIKDTRLATLKVGTKYDIKEDVFREYIGAVENPPTLWFEWEKAKGGADIPKANVTWIKPNGDVAAFNDLPESNPGYLHSKLPLPLEPGIWGVRISDKTARRTTEAKIFGETWFLVPGSKKLTKELHQFYMPLDICIANDGVEGLQACVDTEWSSFSADLKSELRKF